MVYEIDVMAVSVGDLQTFPSGFCKRLLRADTLDKFPQQLEFEFCKDRASLLADVRPGDKLCVSFSPTGREWQGRVFVGLRAWGFKAIAADPAQAGDVPPPEPDDAPSDGPLPF